MSEVEPAAAARPRWQLALRWARRIAEAALIAAAFGLLLLWCSVPDVERLVEENPTTTAFIELRREQARAAGKPFDLKWTWKPRILISRYLRAAVIYSEDGNFFQHEGVDWDAIEKAAARDWEAGEMGRGGSTITQQLAKNLYLSPDRSLVRKLRELWIAYELEEHLGKQRILELYLNVCEWGDGVFGAEAAARRWYGKSAAALTPAQAARLAVALPNPRLRSPEVLSAELDRKAARILRLMRRDQLIDVEQRQRGMEELGLVVPLPPEAPPEAAPPASGRTDAQRQQEQEPEQEPRQEPEPDQQEEQQPEQEPDQPREREQPTDQQPDGAPAPRTAPPGPVTAPG